MGSLRVRAVDRFHSMTFLPWPVHTAYLERLDLARGDRLCPSCGANRRSGVIRNGTAGCLESGAVTAPCCALDHSALSPEKQVLLLCPLHRREDGGSGP